MKRILIFSISVLMALNISGTERFVVFEAPSDGLLLNKACVTFDVREHSCVQRAVGNLKLDFQRVTGKAVESVESGMSILVGTVGVNKQIDQWVKKGLLRDLKGKREKYIIKTIDGQLVIAGSDKRGTVFGIYELSKQIGVSPWYYWADVPIVKHENIYIIPGEYTDGEPAVRYRGIFLNDEAPCLTSWVRNTFGTDYGDHRFYEKVFELILRLKGNFLWPAMWGWAFYADDPENLKTADAMGVIIGTSHHEPMARNHQEYARRRNEWGPWNYQKNKENLDRFFREGIERMKGTDDIVTIGMRGDGDEAMSEDADTKLLQTIVENQRKIIKEVTGKPASNTPQVWALYKEVLDYYDKGMRVPDDVLILLCDDNWGNLRRVPNAKERNHPGGWGLYYHVDYVGAPRNSKWLNVTPIQNMWEQLTLASDYGLDRMWILNVGDLKPMEYPITLFMDMAWNPREFGVNNITDHTVRFCSGIFGEEQGHEAARLLNLCCKYAGLTTAEMLDATTYNVETGEWKQMADAYMRLEAEALRQYITLDAEYRDAYQELILFPVQAMSNIYQMYYAHAMNLKLSGENNPDANIWADRVVSAFRRDSLLCASYNHEIAGGKWNGMMTQKHIGYRMWNDNFPADRMPTVKRVNSDSVGGFVFESQGGYVSMEAAHYHSCTPSPAAVGEGVGVGAKWTEIPFMGRTRSGMTMMPYTSAAVGSLTYRFSLQDQIDSVKIHVIVKSTLDYLNKGGLTYRLSLDGGEAVVVNFNNRLNEDKENIYSIFYPTVARRVVESVVSLPISGQSAGVHSLTLSPDDPGIVFEKIVIDLGGYKPQFLFGEESPCRRL